MKFLQHLLTAKEWGQEAGNHRSSLPTLGILVKESSFCITPAGIDSIVYLRLRALRAQLRFVLLNELKPLSLSFQTEVGNQMTGEAGGNWLCRIFSFGTETKPLSYWTFDLVDPSQWSNTCVSGVATKPKLILRFQSKWLLPYFLIVCVLWVTGVTSHLFHIYKGMIAMLIKGSHLTPHIYFE